MVDDEQATANGYIASVRHSAGFNYRTSGPLLRFDGQEQTPGSSPGLGAHTREVLEELGYAPGDVDRLISSRAAGRAE
jgi:crotonobetainyl-CoA:carnitine CoA-transferase CaiB-like acyl-CoA transferase